MYVYIRTYIRMYIQYVQYVTGDPCYVCAFACMKIFLLIDSSLYAVWLKSPKVCLFLLFMYVCMSYIHIILYTIFTATHCTHNSPTTNRF